MTIPRDIEQAIENLNWSLQGPSSQAWVQKADVRAVLAENQQMREKLQPPAELLTPQAWCDRYRLDIRDPDGWRGKDAPAWETPITLPDFWQRFTRSTVRDLHLIDFDRIVADVKAAKNDRSEK